MRSLRYLNAVLTVIAVLLTATLWTLWSTPQVDAALSPAEAHAQGIANAGQQRMEMIDLLKQVNVQVGQIKDQLSKPLKVEVQNFPNQD